MSHYSWKFVTFCKQLCFNSKKNVAVSMSQRGTFCSQHKTDLIFLWADSKTKASQFFDSILVYENVDCKTIQRHFTDASGPRLEFVSTAVTVSKSFHTFWAEPASERKRSKCNDRMKAKKLYIWCTANCLNHSIFSASSNQRLFFLFRRSWGTETNVTAFILRCWQQGLFDLAVSSYLCGCPRTDLHIQKDQSDRAKTCNVTSTVCV